MEIGGGSGRGFDRNDNLKRKATAQIEVLEHYYAVERYPSPDLMEELSAKLGLSDQQVNVWFQCRRQKDRERIAIGIPLHKVASTMPMASLIAVGEVWGKPVPGSPYGRLMVQQPGVRVPSFGNEGLSTRRYDQFPWTIQHSRAVAAVEKQLGGHFIDNGPVLGFNFDPLPPGAFHTPIEPAVHYKQGGQSHRAELHGGPIQAANQTSLQYQFTQGESSSAAAAYGPRVPPGYYSSPAEAQTIAIALSGGSSYVHGTQLPISGLLRPQGIQSSISQSLGAHVVPQSSSRLNMRVDAIFGGCSTTGEENPLMPSGTQAIGDNRLLARNWKSKDANVGRKVEAQEKRLIDGLIEELDTLRQKVWRFLICFADALSLSPFTIDEFVKVLHDTVHIMLLRSIINDIEGAANSGGGNPRIVEGDFDALVESLDVFGVREPNCVRCCSKSKLLSRKMSGSCKRILTLRPNLYVSTFDRPEASDSFAIQLGRNIAENDDVLRRYSDSEKWMWDECLDDSTLLSAMKWGRRTTQKAVTYFVVKSTASFNGGWSKKHHKHWGLRLISASSSEDLLQLILALLDGAIKKDHLASEACRDDLEWIPCTTSALALRLGEVDESLHCRLQEAGKLICNC
nr:homeobox-ddt domain protein rlt2 [Ipomoea batatas]